MSQSLRIASYNIHKGLSFFNGRMVVHELRDKLASWPKDGLEDSDRDGVLDLDEYLYGFNHPELGANRWTLSPLDIDSDHDGIPDGYEILPQHGLNPTDPSDGSANYQGYLDSIVVPVINPIPDDWSGEWASYMGPTPSLSQGSLPVIWSLVSGPSGMEIDSITGEVFWANPTLDGSPYIITVRAENWTNPGLFDEETWHLTVIPYQITVYVSALSGDDGTGEGSLERPWKSIGFALSSTQGSPSLSVILRLSAGRYEEREADVSERVHLARGRAAKAATVSYYLHHEGVAPPTRDGCGTTSAAPLSASACTRRPGR